jgi:GT2 family glycosyltransferase
MSEIAVVIPTYRRPEGLRRLLDGLADQTLPAPLWEVVVVDDASGPEAAAAIDAVAAASPLPVTVIHAEVNRGQAAARNIGWRACSAALLAFTDDDCVPQREWLESGLELMRSSTRIGVAQGRTVRPAGSESYPYTLRTVAREVSEPSPWFEGCNLFFRREALEEAGGFDEQMPNFAEETSLAWAVLEAGWERGWSEDAVVEHDLSERPWRWHMRFHFLEGNLVRVASQHPQIRTMFWRPWAVSQENAYFALGALGVAIGWRRRAAALLAIPYLVWLFGPPERRPSPTDAARIAAFKVSTHAASLAGKLIAGAQTRSILL